MRVLVQWSGGIESTSLLKWFLTNTDYNIVAHNVVVQGSNSGSARLREEEQAMTKLLPLLTSIRPFGMERSGVLICGGKADVMERSIQWPLTMAAMKFLACDFTVRGMCIEDNYARELRDGTWVYWDTNPGKTIQERRKAWVQNVVGGILAADRMTDFNGKDIHDVVPWHETYAWSKAEHVAYLGDMLQHTWSCRRPQEGKPCGKCHSCVERAAAEHGKSVITKP